jgi:hypothetical protein
MVIPQPRSLLVRNCRAISRGQKRGGFFVDVRYRSARLGLVAPMVGMEKPPAILFPGILSLPLGRTLFPRARRDFPGRATPSSGEPAPVGDRQVANALMELFGAYEAVRRFSSCSTLLSAFGT